MFEGESDKEDKDVKSLRKALQKMKVVSRAKVTGERIYSAAYHPEKTKDVIFFGGEHFCGYFCTLTHPIHIDKHGQLGIWDARAQAEEEEDEDGDVVVTTSEGGKYWRLQPHWPATGKSSLSCIKFDPLDAHSVRE